MGILTASTATGQLVFLPVLAWLVTRDGWRSAALLLAGAALVLAPLAALRVRDFPADKGLAPYGGTKADAVRPDVTGHAGRAAVAALRDGLRHQDFWILAGTFFICGLSTNGWYYGLRGLSLFFLPPALGSTAGARWRFATFYGLDWIATVPPTVRLTADTFGRARVGMMFGWIVAAHQLGAATAALGAGLIHTRLGDYTAAFWAAGALCLVAAALVFGLGKPAHVPGRHQAPSERLAVEV